MELWKSRLTRGAVWCCVDGREEWKDQSHPLQIWFGVTDFLVWNLSSFSACVLFLSITV